MKASTVLQVLLVLSLAACNQSAPSVTPAGDASASARAHGDGEVIPPSDSEGFLFTGPASSPCDAVQKAQKAGKVVTYKTLQAAVAATCIACQGGAGPGPNPPHPDAGTGGSISATGGRAATGGNAATGGTPGTSAAFAKCVAAKTADSSVKNVAKQTGQSVSSLVQTICSDPTILGAYNK